MEPEFTFTAAVWEWSGDHPSWFMLTVPEDESDQIEELTTSTVGFGSVKVEVTIGDTQWRTSLFPSKEAEAYVLPLKKAVRKAEGLEDGTEAEVTVRILL